MWMWNSKLERDVFVAKVEPFEPGLHPGITWLCVYFWMNDSEGWVKDFLSCFEPPHNH